jgi:hypothetical protein
VVSIVLWLGCFARLPLKRSEFDGWALRRFPNAH